MELEVLNKIINRYNQEIQRKKHYSDILKQVKELEEDENVKKYITLKNRLEQVDYQKIITESETQILYSTFNSYQYMINNTNEIYVCMGTFMMESTCDIVHGPGNIRVNRNDPRAEYCIYRNIEDGYSEVVTIHKCEEFERTHTVIFPKIAIAERYYYQLQKEFISLAVTEGQEKAYQKILNRKK